MYHDEFVKKPVWNRQSKDVPVPVLPLELGGGLSLSLAASLNPPVTAILFSIGGVLPLVTSSLAIAAHRSSEALKRLTHWAEVIRRPKMPTPHLMSRLPTSIHRSPTEFVRAGLGQIRRMGSRGH